MLRQQPHLHGDQQQADAVDNRQPLHRGEARDRRPDQAAERHPGRPGLQDRFVHRSMRPMRRQRPQRGGDDGQQRGTDGDVQITLAAHAQHRKGVEQGRHQHRPAADPEQPADHPRDRARRDQGRSHHQKFGQGQSAHGLGIAAAFASVIPERIRPLLRSRPAAPAAPRPRARPRPRGPRPPARPRP
ncbi:hypothetical protein D3C80_1389300 [compost metagenome]